MRARVSTANNATATALQQRAMRALCLLLIVLQAADAISTHLALGTGLAREKNELLLLIAHWLTWSVMDAVYVAKSLTAGLFAIAMFKARASAANILLLAILSLYFILVVGMNFYWASTLR